ncbi:MAG: 4-(cytidine 5'-diphospho)-2-C-methyl-D-erythritol kinase [Enterobacterales bacterium]|nr:4-(cytidine 5'-diphospho)-2-C-methyl-D-erythritol kinase [Enterobacterales bacterium]
MSSRSTPSFGQNSYWPCPAKLNLFLQIIGQRSDGYHLLQSYFQLLDVGDQLSIIPTEQAQISFSCSNPSLQNDDNLVVKAANLLQSKSNTPWGAKLHLLKKLPIGGGVGGGSSDCATCLLALNKLWQCGFSLKQLAAIGESLGADVAFFIYGQSGFVEGIGEKITPYPIPNAHFLVIQPSCSIATSEIFSNPLLTRNSKAITIRDLKTLSLPFDGFNTLQSLVVDSYPLVKNALEWLTSRSSTARMTGSGSSLFSVFDNQQEASKIAAQCDSSWQVFVARGVNLSGLHDELGYTFESQSSG